MDRQSAFTHLNALRERLLRETRRLALATPRDLDFRRREVARAEQEIAGEVAFLAARGIKEPVLSDMSDDELLAAPLDGGHDDQ